MLGSRIWRTRDGNGSVFDYRRKITGCVQQDITFMVDSSQGVGADNFRKELDFIKSTISDYEISPGCIRISIVTYGTVAHNQFYLDGYQTKGQLLNAIDSIQYQPGRPYATEGLKFVTDQSFSSLHGARNGVPHLGVMVMSTPPSNSQAFQQEAQRAKAAGIKLFSVGVGSGAHLPQLATAASNPSNQYSFTAQNFDSLADLSYPLYHAITREAPAPSTSTAQCLQRADLVFLVDSSGSIGANNFLKLKDFLKGITGKLNVGPNAVHVGLMQFSNYPSMEFPLDTYTTSGGVMQGIDNMNYMQGGTNTGDAIKYMTSQMFSQNSGARSNVPRIAVVITDGKSSNSALTAAAADQARLAHIGMLAVGVGAGVDMNELHSIADNPDSQNTFTVNSYDQLDSISTQIINKACQVSATSPPRVTSSPGGTMAPDPCSDMLSNCKQYGQQVCVNYAPWAKDNCARYCGLCQPLYTTAPPPCVDHLNNCPSYGTDVCLKPTYKGWAEDNCRKFCGFCGPATSAVGFYGQCSYKGKSYNHGEKWTDGCDYECVCEDGTSGRYRCYNRCPLYYNLPPQCTLVRSPTECCQQPVCNFNPNINKFELTAPATNSFGMAVCAYKGKQYFEGQSWDDGCQYRCTCATGSTGLVQCQDRCPTYSSLPPYCHLDKKAGKCCAEPVCEFSTQQGSFTGTGSVSGLGVGLTPTAPPACANVLTNCERYESSVCTSFPGWAADNCRKHCNLCDVKPTPGPNDTCLYQGRIYHQGQGWMVSCDTQCVCENAAYGYYRCVNTCPTYNNLPQGCYETKKAGECCSTVQCDTGSFLTSTNNLNTIGNGGMITIQNPSKPQIAPTLPSGGKPQPGTGGTGFTAPTLSGCLYKGNMYIQDQRWDDGCDYSCRCMDSKTGYYSCTERCPSYQNLPIGCHMSQDADDSCCMKPVCNDPSTPLIPSFQQGNIGHGVVEPPSVTDLYNNTYNTIHYEHIYTSNVVAPTAPSVTSQPGIGYCIYKGQKHNQGEQWQDSCDYNCVCEDASIGKWRCTERCRKYPNLPAPCHLVADPQDSCCQVPFCDFTPTVISFNGSAAPITRPQTPVPVRTTPIPTTPRPKVCIYNGKQYAQGQLWYDGCQYKCTCDDAEHGFFRCTNRCPEYKNVPDSCTMVKDAQDPACCEVPYCNFQTTSSSQTGQGVVPSLPPGSFQGQSPDQTNPNIGFCLYKGSQYQQGQTWMDGCEYSCNCQDATRGLYTCTDRCPRYGSIPYPCKLVTDYRQPCCKIPDCQFAGSLGEITGTLTPAPHVGPTNAPTPGLPGQPGQPTPSPMLNYCLYKGVKYYQDQTWDDGCEKRCRCDDSSKGLYVCDTRCASYADNLPAECHMVVSASDSCCREPKCDIPSSLQNVTGTIRPDMIPTLAPPGVFIGSANTPTPRPNIGPNPVATPAPQPLNYCEYKGAKYSQGQTWFDGCSYSCQCMDSSTGNYKCTERCPKYGTLPPQCYLQKDPANPCCSKPECTINPSVSQITGQGTTLAPVPGQSIAPTPYPGYSPTPNPNPTPALPKDVCEYKGQSYTQGQTWYDDCEYVCNCENAPAGIYRCSQRCPQYQVPAGCTTIQDPSDPLCCKIPKCDIPPQYNNVTGYVPIPTPPPGVITGGSVTKVPTLAPGQQPTLVPGVNPTLAPGVSPTPAPAFCEYKNQQYTQGQKWQDGCAYNCECVDAVNGRYRCTELCPRYPALPPQCRLVPDVIQPCCKKPYCEFTGTTNNITGTVTLSPNPLNTPAPIPGQTPSVDPTPAPNAPDTCLYNGVPFKQGATWDDGCDLKCVCEDGVKGFYRCSDRCPRYNTLPDGCVLITDPRDSCCRIPDCKPVAQPTNAPGISPTPGPGINPNPNPTPNPSPNPMIPSVTNVINGQGVTPTPGPNMPQPTGPPVCLYKGVTYQQGQTWQDGCDLNCVCTEASTGKYRCSQRCQMYPNLPTNCRLALDPADQCCRIAVCNPTPAPGITPNPNPNVNPNPNPTLAPQPGQPTPGINPTPGQTPNPNATPQPTPKNVCIMNGRQYTQGQQWYTNGCDRTCVCDDASTGFYRCYDRCRKYDSIPSGCTLVSDPNDPQCCKVPQCIPTPGVNGFPTPGPTDTPQLITGVPVGIINGYGTPTPAPNPTLLPGQTPNPNPQPTPAPKEVCVYKGTEYHQGQRWVDGCKYTCVCIDSKAGHYECTEKCPVYPRMPPYCTLVQDPMNICCQRPKCDFNNIPTAAPAVQPTPAPNGSPAPGVTPAPGVSTLEPAPNVGTTLEPGPPSYCVYNGVPYTQSQSWDVGCTKRCRCDDADKNYYTCFDRCPIYPAQQGCTLVTDPKDACCQIPRCVVVPTPGPTPNPNPNPNVGPTLVPPTGTTLEPPPLGTLKPNPNPGMTPVATPFPSPVPTGQTGVIIGKPQNPQNPSGRCNYKGVQYTTGQKWDDGCTYKCECLDQISGQYKCTERCPRFVQIPSYCRLVSDPNDQCCRTPSCPNLTPTLKPGYTPAPQPTLNPPLNTQSPPVNPQPTPGGTPAPSAKPPLPKNVCVMNGKSYTQGQKWDDGCDRTCVCTDGMTGHYTCTDRCPQYNNIAPSCVMVPDPNDPICCKIPQCSQTNPNVAPTGIIGTITGSNPYPTAQPNPQPTPNPNPNPNPTLSPNPNPNAVNPTPNPTPNPNSNPTPNPNPNPYPFPTPYPGGTYPPYMLTAIPVPGTTAVPGLGTTQNPAPKVCVYKGAMYQTGQRWRDGCDYDCICEDGMTGKYRCTTVCPKYPNLPSGCRLVMDMNNPCCKKADCTPVAVLTPAPIPGQSPTPNPNPTPTPAFCVFNGIPFKQGQTWQDGCSRTCKCEDAMSRQITCNDRCPTYPSLKAGCTLVTDPKDQCCQVPQCINPNATNPLLVVTGPKGTIEGSNLPQPGVNNPGTSGKSNVCLYNGKTYQSGQTWDDGCTYQCVCTDGSTGHYQCTERCPKIPTLPPTCTLVKDTNDQCCQNVYCPNSVPTPGPTPNPNPMGQPTPKPNVTPNPNPTPAPQPNVCVYKGQNYQQDQTWYDGCNAKCRCENAATGYYRCQERCARYPSVPAACTLVPSPTDPTCCKEPSCPVIPTAGPTPTPGFIPNPMTPKPGEITGLAPVPTNMPTPAPGATPLPGVNPTPVPRKGCYYKGVVHPKGSTWDDGCQFTCECLDDMTGQYRCLEKCAKFPNLDSRCVLLQDPSEPCCKKPYCDLINPTPFPNGVPTPKPNIAPTPGGIVPSLNTQSPNPTTPRPGFCVYKGVAYTQGQQWTDGCSQKCQCDDSTTGYYTCHARCPSYPQVPSSCVLKTDPSDTCCLVPDCNQILAPVGPTSQTGSNPINVSPVTGTGPSGTGTPAPQYIYPTPVQPGSFTGTGSNPNPQAPIPGSSGTRSVCIYKGQMYTQGQKWDDGCQYQCECLDAVRGQYRCTGRCPQYYFLPPQCTYVQDPNDRCCQKARCNPNPGATPLPNVNPTPTAPIVIQPNTNSPQTGTGTPVVVQPNTNPPQTGTGSPVVIQPNTNPPQTGTGSPVVIQPNTNPPQTGGGGSNPNPQTTSITGTGTACVYKGKIYPKGQMWRDGCDYQCICDDPTSNAYRCVATCKSYSTIPSFCSLTPDPKDQCCEVVTCTAPNGQQLTPMLPSNTPTPSPTLTPNLLHVVPIGTHDVFTGTGHPPVGSGGSNTGGRNGCVYKNKVYMQGQSWDDGCKYTCSCEDGTDGRYKCATKCPSYPAIPKYCTYINVPGQCCPSLSCNSPDYGKYTPTPQLVPSPAPSTAPGQVPTPAPNSNPHIIVVPGAGTSNGGSGPATIVPGTPLTGFSGTTSQYCIYKNKLYNQGNTWTDGCDYSCECLDGRSGYYKCKPLCPVYDKLPSQCFMVRAADQCCAQPMCSNPDGSQVNPLNGNSPYPVYGSYPGGFTGFKPSYTPGQSTSISGTTPGCVYKGTLYSQGQKWDDGCDYQCTCTDATGGQYTCYAKCPTYTSIPSVCKMFDVPGQCCQEIRCDTSGVPTTPRAPNAPTPAPRPHPDPNCYDFIDNCNMYGKSACGSNFQAWAQKNCNKYCGFCTSTITSAPPRCEDKISNCVDYGQSACLGIYKPWAMDNCIKYCNLCTGTGSGTVVTSAPVTQPPTTVCVDKLNNCQNYDASTCSDTRYTAWAHENCPKFCGFCTGTGTVSQPIIVNALPPQGWFTVLKGVAGAPGDLFTIWNRPGGYNENVPQAMYLTNQFPGHYKPSLSDHWNDLCIDRVKVSIYNQGQEKAYITFNAVGADKNSWFTADRIIDSSYTDIRNAPKELFSLMGDVTSGREFTMNSHSSSNCDSFGWMMVATQSGCSFEASAGNKPAFLYSPGQTALHWGQNTASGDVFAITAHGSCTQQSTMQPSGFTQMSKACIYKSKIYHQGEYWTDGCEYNCTCADENTGRYNCVNLCATFTNLPQGCTLSKKPGECCALPDCGNFTLPGSGQGSGFCYYKGQMYGQGQQWNDGCDFKCTCQDATTGTYRCTDRCYQWNLPTGLCTLENPPPGKCCPVPKCSAQVVLQYPPGYVQE